MKQLVVPAALLLALTGCGADKVGAAPSSLQSCFDTGDGVTCVAGDDIALAKKLRGQAIEHLVADEYEDAAMLLSQALGLNANDGDTLRLFEMAKEGQAKQAARRQEKLVKYTSKTSTAMVSL